MKEIPLSQGKVAFVDDADYARLTQRKWYTHLSYGNWYARSHESGSGKTLLMHRLVLNAPDGVEVDHADGNGLNNCRSNLRLATGPQNQLNRRRHKDNKCGYKGVCWVGHSRKWKARIMLNGVNKSLGCFFDPAEAARAYDAAAKELHGEFASLNFPEGLETSI